ncbi:MAG: hypothetical protein AAF236_10785, partial [Verrucomicrobiota bacterium]
GGLTAFYAGACDPSLNAVLASGCFGLGDRSWEEPIYRNIFGLTDMGGPAGIAALYGGRTLIIEHSEFPEIVDHKGSVATPDAAAVSLEIKRTAELLAAFQTPPGILFSEAAEGTRAGFPAVAALCAEIGHNVEVSRFPTALPLFDTRTDFDPDARHERVFRGVESCVQRLVDQSTETREEYFFFTAETNLQPGKWSTERIHPTLEPSGFIEASAAFREQFSKDVIGEFDEAFVDPSPRSRQILENEKWTGWEVVLEVYEGFFAWGVLLMPNDIEEGENRPVVVCQHGRNGLPRDTVDAGKSAYSDFAATLADRGYITFSPHNLYRHEDRYRWLDRKANQIGCTLFSFITASHQQILTWLATLPQVNREQIAFYGLSYGGESAMRVPALLDGYALSICSGDFNQWTRKVADPDFPASFMKTIEWEMPYWNLGNTFDYGEMAGLIFPRPFFVERGHHDGVSRDRWVAHEYARVRWLYAQFGLGDRTRIEFFQGGHSVNGVGSFAFLDEFLPVK